METDPYVRLVRVVLWDDIEMNEEGLPEIVNKLLSTLAGITTHTCKNGRVITHNREQGILKMRYGLDGEKPHTLQAIAEHFGVTRERIRQIESRGIRKLRHPSRVKHLAPFIKNDKDRTAFEDQVKAREAQWQEPRQTPPEPPARYFNPEFDEPIDNLELSARSSNGLNCAGVYSVGHLVTKTEEDVRKFKSLGRKSINELREVLAEKGLSFGMVLKEV